ncbi:MAG: TonB-dependent receptor [Prolixibacteraceae bacterium]|nr:TonB-dependent receptor [Prolixibacteraceae bacterium]MBN2773835.1 TonB-dependent receptor [Prolixibacteraceae bacterium]
MNTIKTALLLFIVFVFTMLSYAQNSINGKITDSETHESLAGANIIIKNTTIGIASDNEGNFSISGLNNGEYILRVSYFGYETIEKEISLTGSALSLNIAMVPTTIDLNAVVVTGTRTEKTLKNTPVLTQTISARELETKDLNDISQALENLIPGIEFSSEAQGKTISLQGIDPQYMLFLVDGERMAGETYGDIDYSRINIADIERIEVVKGAGSTLYGSNALGGVVNIITKTPSKKIDLDASTRFSNYNTQNHRLSFGSKIGKVASQTSATFDKTDGYDLLEGNSYRTQEKEDALVLNQHLKYSLSEKFLLEGNLAFMSKNRENTSADLYDRRNKDLTYGFKANYFINQQNNISLSWNADNYELLNKVDENNLVSDYNNLYKNARLLGNFQLYDRNLLTVGAEYLSENLNAPRNNIDDKTNTDYIIFGQEDLQVGDKINVIAGARAHHNSQYGWHFTPQVSGMVKVWHFAFRGNYSKGYKTPTLKEKYMSFQIPAPGPPMFLVGKEDLEPETSNYASVSMEYTRSGVSFSVSAYRNKISNMISENLDTFTVKPGGIIEYAYRNYEEVILTGVDILLKTKIVNNLFFTGITTFSKKVNNITNEEFNNVRNFTGKFNLNYNTGFKNYKLNLNLQSNFYGSRKIELMDEMTHQVNTVELKSFSLWKLTSTHTINSKYIVKAGVDNIFDFVDESGGYNNGTSGRTFFLGVGIRL